jgi:phosphoenolpyruvate carboxykinase (GTP)
VFRVNWFRADDKGRFMWPGFGDNLRVLKWILERCEGHGRAVETPIGFLPTPEALDHRGLDLDPDVLRELLDVKPEEWVEAVAGQAEYLRTFGDRMPEELWDQQRDLSRRVEEAVTPGARGR